MKKWKIAALGLAAEVLLTGCGATVNGLTLPASLEIAAGESQAMELGYVFSSQELDDAAQQKAIEAAGITWTVSGDGVSIGADGTPEPEQAQAAKPAKASKQAAGKGRPKADRETKKRVSDIVSELIAEYVNANAAKLKEYEKIKPEREIRVSARKIRK